MYVCMYVCIWYVCVYIYIYIYIGRARPEGGQEGGEGAAAGLEEGSDSNFVTTIIIILILMMMRIILMITIIIHTRRFAICFLIVIGQDVCDMSPAWDPPEGISFSNGIIWTCRIPKNIRAHLMHMQRTFTCTSHAHT